HWQVLPLDKSAAPLLEPSAGFGVSLGLVTGNATRHGCLEAAGQAVRFYAPTNAAVACLDDALYRPTDRRQALRLLDVQLQSQLSVSPQPGTLTVVAGISD